jgi:hypothetical protein
MSCTAAVDSCVSTILRSRGSEIRLSTISERGARIDDKRSEAAGGKQQGYFFRISHASPAHRRDSHNGIEMYVKG